MTPRSTHTHAWAVRISRALVRPPTEHLGLHRGDTVLALVAHPDDETLAMGASLSRLAADGVDVRAVSLTCGEAAVRHVGLQLPSLGQQRRQEMARAGEALGLLETEALDLPDSALAHRPHTVAAAVAGSIDKHAPDHVLTLWRHDPHPDHQAVGHAAVTVARQYGVAVSELLLWTPHWTDPALVDDAVVVLDSGEEARRAKARAVGQYHSQVRPLADHLQPVLPPEVVGWPFECAVRR